VDPEKATTLAGMVQEKDNKNRLKIAYGKPK
jgi:hypothetical protein